MSESQINVAAGGSVRFIGFSNPEEVPDNGTLLQEGETYVVHSVNPSKGDNEESINVQVENPEFNAKKRKSGTNVEFLLVDLFPDEFEELEGADEGEEEEEHEKVLTLAEVNKDDSVSVTDDGGEILSGKVLKKSKTSLVILVKEDDGSESEVTYAAKEIAKIVAEESEEEPEPEVKPATKTTRAAKAKATEKAESKPVAKPAAKSKLKETTAVKKTGKVGRPPKVKAEAEVEDEDLKNMIILTEEEEDEDILALVENNEDICALAAEMADEAAVQDYRLGGILYHVRVSKAFRQIENKKYDVQGGFAAYVEQELGTGYRKAMYLIDIYAKWNKFGLDSDKVAEIGWTKAQQIARVMDADNAEKLIEAAEGQSVADLKETIKESYSKKGVDTREVVKKITFKFRLVEDSGVVIQGYLEQAARQLKHKKLEQTFEHIVTEWAQENLDVSVAKTARAATPVATTRRGRTAK